ncbi:restriction endonuclease [Nocardia asteroides NBRC 15531]|uniref:Restriction endonuclease n=1 Tax=Nocardia asteroides NBRC 15531 TaxID=1110697 RepID=U5EKR5_NOCAS|nr:restriction endonuclease [Nocardia asteroides]TLF65738.1 restriction endonuclease [Nocardia asteroides NBRC 15531]UGT47490.1 restriction endonuclease [Nocardia asteroides]SFM46557.1 restriction system protein [Nocardia asteroides]VEG33604.1 Uncharacterized proteins involved in stress response, homologs of TerZ and putative cAMP-binding protein CABP1 [Nocardia asteroides]GAD87845.1 putative restriction endonuclease [Nocardia asteroides NBRC 15531]
MGSKRGFFQELEHRQRLAEQAEARQQRALERERKQAERAVAGYQRQARADYIESRKHNVEKVNRSLAEWVETLTSLLTGGLDYPVEVDLGRHRSRLVAPVLDLGVYARAEPAPQWDEPEIPSKLARMFGGAQRHRTRVDEARAQFEAERRAHQIREADRRAAAAREAAEHDVRLEEWERQVAAENAAVDARAAGIGDRHPDDVIWLAGEALAQLALPAQFPRAVEVAFDPRAELLVVRFELPPHTIVPEQREFRYIATKDEERAVARTKAQLSDLYRETIAQTALLAIRALFGADQAVQSVHLDGYVQRRDPATGALDAPTIISTTVEREQMPSDENLRHVEPQACLRSFDTLISAHPYEVEPIASTLDFDWGRYRFAKEFDAAATLDSRPDLMAMSPTEFEHLVRQLFQAQGAEGWTTQQSNDDGVDAVIAKRTPLVGGLSIVQAKQYQRVIGVNHLRELAGTIEEKKAAWGILITTSWFTSGCAKKAREHGRMELIDGQQLVPLIKEHLGKDVVIGIRRPRPPRNNPPPLVDPSSTP